ncbi:MAG: DUF1659 domain-containing protein [Phascolarctobacterium sp.]|nr:DUF1659 domain-containing protein [Phascolarctobacterium sp.]
MAVAQELIRRSLVINVEDGFNADGSVKTKSRTYSDIKETTSIENLYNAGNALAGLMANTLSSIMLSDRSELVEE